MRLDRRRLQRVLEFIEAHIEDDLNVATLASTACLSPRSIPSGPERKYRMSHVLCTCDVGMLRPRQEFRSIPAHVDVDAFPAKETGIDRPCARSEHRQAESDDSANSVNSLNALSREGGPKLQDRLQHPGNWGPKTGHQQDANREPNAGYWQRQGLRERRQDCVVTYWQRKAGHDAKEHEPNPWPCAGKCGE